MSTLRQAAILWLRTRVIRRHGQDRLPILIHRRRVYIVPSRYGLMLALLLAAMLVAGLNYNSNLGLAFAFLMSSLALVAMHHCNRNLLGLELDAQLEIDAFAGEDAQFEFVMRNSSRIDRCDIEIRCAADARTTATVAAGSSTQVSVLMPVARRGVTRLTQIELRTGYPFGWFRAWTYVQGPLTAFVAPKPGGDRLLPSAAAQEGSAYRETRGDEDFAGLRPYQAGVSLKHMAWKVLARGGEAAMRSYSGSGAQAEWLEWSALAGLESEARLSQLCRWVLDSDSNRSSYGLRIPGTEVAPSRGVAHRSVCLRALASYEADTA